MKQGSMPFGSADQRALQMIAGGALRAGDVLNNLCASPGQSPGNPTLLAKLKYFDPLL